MQPHFLTLEQAVKIHDRQIAAYGGEPSVRDITLLQSALAMPAASFGGEFLHPNLAAMGAAYLFHIVSNHPFVDGNKRTGAAASRVFMLMNDAEFSPPAKEFEELVLTVARGEASKEVVTEFFRR